MKAPSSPRIPRELDVQLEIVHVVRLRVSGSPAFALAAVALVLILLMVLGLAGRL
jgi:hypothetical protein